MDKSQKKVKREIRSDVETDKTGTASKPVSLAPLTFDEALDGLLGVKPEPKGEPRAAKKPTKKPAKKAR